MEVTAGDKHSSLLRKSVNYGRKKFYGTGAKLASKGLTRVELTAGDKHSSLLRKSLITTVKSFTVESDRRQRFSSDLIKIKSLNIS